MAVCKWCQDTGAIGPPDDLFQCPYCLGKKTRQPNPELRDAHWSAHEARVALINKPFPAIQAGRRLPPSYLWAGTIVGDRFYGDGQDHSGRRRSGAYDADHGNFDYVIEVD